MKIKGPKEPWFAVNLSMFFAGIGQIYSGRIVRGCILIFSLYYAKWRRITPVILTHLYFDFLALITYSKY